MHKESKYIVTGVNRITGERQAICRPKSRTDAQLLIDRWHQDKGHRGHKPYLRLRLERVQPIQLTIQFPEYETD